MQKVKESTDKHLVFVADSDGINTVFPMLVERLKDDRLYGEHLTLLYVSDKYGFVFKEELDILTKHFPIRFLTCYESSHRQETLTDVCETVNPDAPVGAYGFDLAGWLGGQSEYCLIPYADFQLLKFPDREQALEKILDLTSVSDILPTGYHGAYAAGVTTGSTVYIAGAEPVGRCAAESAKLLGASCVIVGDMNKERLELVKQVGMETVDLTLYVNGNIRRIIR